MWRGLWRKSKRDEDWQEESETGELDAAGVWLRPALRLTVVFALLFGGVLFAFWWAGSAVRFSAARAGDRSVPTWRVSGKVRDAVTHQPIPWALVEDDPAGQPPLFRAEADYTGIFELLTLAEPHRVRVSASGYRPLLLEIGRAWFVWMPGGSENKIIDLVPVASFAHPQREGKHRMCEKVRIAIVSKPTCIQYYRVVDSSWLD
jgi:hypothetical protein